MRKAAPKYLYLDVPETVTGSNIVFWYTESPPTGSLPSFDVLSFRQECIKLKSDGTACQIACRSPLVLALTFTHPSTLLFHVRQKNKVAILINPAASLPLTSGEPHLEMLSLLPNQAAETEISSREAEEVRWTNCRQKKAVRPS